MLNDFKREAPYKCTDWITNGDDYKTGIMHDSDVMNNVVIFTYKERAAVLSRMEMARAYLGCGLIALRSAFWMPGKKFNTSLCLSLVPRG
jgi:hypothetical protein